jgi:dipeptidyl aminopeptidase/acylaminoacyl peptidase
MRANFFGTILGLLLCLGFFANSSVGQQAERAGKRLQPTDMDRLIGVSEPRISPDGRSVVVVVSRVNRDKNRQDRELVLVDVATAGQRVLTQERPDVGQPRWSPSGDRLAFLAASGPEKEAKRQIYVMPMNGGDARRITNAPLGIQHFAWSPDGTQIAFATADEPAKREKNDDAFEIHNDGYLLTKAPTSTHIWLTAADGSKTRRLTSGDWSLPSAQPPGAPSSPLSWAPDGAAIAFVRQATPHFGDSDQAAVQTVNVRDGAIRPFTGRKAHESHPSFSPDGRWLTYTYPRDGDSNNVNEIHLAAAMGEEGKSLTRTLDRHIVWSSWLPDSKTVLVGGHDGTRVALWLATLDGPPSKLDLGKVNPSGSYSMDVHVGPGGAIAFCGSPPWRPAELYYQPSRTATPRRLTDFNKDIAALDLGTVETITWKGPDGFEEDGVLVLPPEFSAAKKYPLVLYIHGGPTSASTEAFAVVPQLIAAHDYVVFSPNYRGSDNRGIAYQRAIFNDAGAGPGRDVMAGVEAVKQRGCIDADRMAVTGWSYGGFMTTWLCGHYHCWKTAIAGATPADRADQYNFADYNLRAGARFLGSPWVGDNDKAYREQSPITYAAKIKTPMLILSDTGDARVPVTQSFRLYHALKDNGVPVHFVVYPVSGHSPSDPARRQDLARRWVAWLDQYLR